MSNTLTVNNQELMIKEFDGHRVVHMWDIGKLHGVPTNNVRTNFKRNIKYLIDGEDYFLIEKQSEFASTLSCSGDLSQKVINASKDIPIFTESGYLMMTKPMTDEISWQVQRQLVNCYFKVKEVHKAPEHEPKELRSLADVNKTIELLTGAYKSMGVSDADVLKTVKALIESTGLNIPNVYLPKVVDKSSFITIEEIAERVGIYDVFSSPNIEAVAYVLSIIKLDYAEFKSTMYVDDNSNVKYFMTFSPNLILKVSGWLSARNYPQFLEKAMFDGRIKKILVIYRNKIFHY